MSTEEDVSAAAAVLVSAFGMHDVAGYFAAFAPDASFLFHTTSRLLESRADYEAEWRTWEDASFQVLGCESLEGRVQVVGPGLAVFTHRVRTRVRDADGEHDLAERETIVFRHEPDGRWLGVHEHLSPEP